MYLFKTITKNFRMKLDLSTNHMNTEVERVIEEVDVMDQDSEPSETPVVKPSKRKVKPKKTKKKTKKAKYTLPTSSEESEEASDDSSEADSSE